MRLDNRQRLPAAAVWHGAATGGDAWRWAMIICQLPQCERWWNSKGAVQPQFVSHRVAWSIPLQASQSMSSTATSIWVHHQMQRLTVLVSACYGMEPMCLWNSSRLFIIAVFLTFASFSLIIFPPSWCMNCSSGWGIWNTIGLLWVDTWWYF